jgi:hypothetical protein
MIPLEFDFHVVVGTGIIFHAVLDDDMENYTITSKNLKCKYTVKEVMDFLSKGIWRQGLI